MYKLEADNKVYLSVDVPRRGSASPAEVTIGGHSPAAAFPKPRLVEATVISERAGTCPPSRRVAGSCASGLCSSLFSRLKHGGPEREVGVMFRRKLTALDYHNPAGFNCKGEPVVPGRPCAAAPAGRRALSAPHGGSLPGSSEALSTPGAPCPALLLASKHLCFPPPLLFLLPYPDSGQTRASEPPHPLLPQHPLYPYLLNSRDPPPHSQPRSTLEESIRFLTFLFRLIGQYFEHLLWASGGLETEEDAE